MWCVLCVVCCQEEQMRSIKTAAKDKFENQKAAVDKLWYMLDNADDEDDEFIDLLNMPLNDNVGAQPDSETVIGILTTHTHTHTNTHTHTHTHTNGGGQTFWRIRGASRAFRGAVHWEQRKALGQGLVLAQSFFFARPFGHARTGTKWRAGSGVLQTWGRGLAFGGAGPDTKERAWAGGALLSLGLVVGRG